MRKPREFPYCTSCRKTRKNPDEQMVKNTKFILCKICETRLSWILRKKQRPNNNNLPRRHTKKELEELKNHRRRIREVQKNKRIQEAMKNE